MEKLLFTCVMIIGMASSAHAACYADYKAKQDNPLRLHYGVAEISGDCSTQSAADQLQSRLAGDGWQLLNILGVFDESGLDGRKDSAGEYFLRY